MKVIKAPPAKQSATKWNPKKRYIASNDRSFSYLQRKCSWACGAWNTLAHGPRNWLSREYVFKLERNARAFSSREHEMWIVKLKIEHYA